MSTVRWARAAAAEAAATGPKVRWARAAGDGPAPITPKVRWGRAAADGAAAVAVAALPDLPNIEPESTVFVTAALVGGGSPDSWTWRRISGPAIGINGTGSSVSFTAPSVLAGTSLVVGVTATTGTTTSPERTFTVSVLPQTEWWWTGTGWIPHLEVWTAPDTLVSATVTPNV